MSLRVKSVCVLFLWLVLFAYDFADDTGLIDDVQEDLDRSVDAVLEDFGQAVKSSGGPQLLMPEESFLRFHPPVPALANFINFPTTPLSAQIYKSLGAKPSKFRETLQVFLI
jgi:hypothetical protein